MSNQRSRVRYRGSLGSAALGLWDGFAVLSIGWFTTSAYHGGVFDDRYGVLLLALLVAMGVTYERFGVYAPYGRFTNETIALVKAWLVAFGVLLVIACLAKETEAYSRFVLVVLFSGGLTAQWAGHLVFRLIRHRLERAPRLESAMVIGNGALADQLYLCVRDNPWIGQRIIGAVSPDPSAAETRQPMHAYSAGKHLPFFGSTGSSIISARRCWFAGL